MRKFRIIHLLFLLFLVACSEDEGEMAPEATCTDGIQNGDETGIDCGGSCDACPEPCSDEVSFPIEATYGINILRDTEGDTITITPTEFTSMLANTTEVCTEVKVTIQYVDGEGCEGCWFFSPPLTVNWDVQAYDFSNNQQTFVSTATGSTPTTKELPIFGFVGGVYEITYYINDSLTHVNYLASVPIPADPFLSSDPITSITGDGSLLYVTSADLNFFGTVDLTQEAPEILNEVTGTSQGMAVKDQLLYYFDYQEGAIMRRDLLGGGNPEVVLTGISQTFDMVFYGDKLIFTDDFAEVDDRKILMVDITDPDLEVTTIISGMQGPMAFSVEGDTFYYLDGPKKAYSFDLTIERATPELIVAFEEVINTPDMIGMVVYEGDLYYAGPGTVGRIDLETQEISLVASTNINSFYTDLYIHNDVLYFPSFLEGLIYKKEL